MTLPAGSIDPQNLPVGVVDPSQLGKALQDNTKQKFTDVAAGRFPAIVSGTSAGNPADAVGPLGFIVDLFAKLSEDVANADPASIQTPDDLLPLITDFFEGLPIIGFFVDLLEVMQGTYTGDDVALQGIQDFITLLRDLVNGAVAAFGGDFGPLTQVIDGLFDPPDWLDINGWVAAISATIDDVEDKIAYWLHRLADLLDMVPIVGDSLAAIIDNLANGLNNTHSTATTASGTANSALNTAQSKNAVTKTPTQPSLPNLHDIWVDISSGANIFKLWSGSSWVTTTDKTAVDAAATAQAAQAAINKAIAELPGTGSVSGQVSAIADDIRFVSDTEAALDPADWTYVGYGDTASALLVQRNLNISVAGSSPVGQTYHAIAVTTFAAAGGQSMSTVLASIGSSIAPTMLVIAADNTMATGVAAILRKSNYYLGPVTRSGTTWTTSGATWAGTSGTGYTFAAGQRVEFQVDPDGQTWRLLVNGAIVFQHVQSGFTAANRLRAVVASGAATNTGYNTREEGFALRQVLLSNITGTAATPALDRTGWSLWRNATGSSGTVTWNENGAAFPSGTFDTQAAVSGVTVIDQGTGLMRIDTVGTYIVSASDAFGNISGTAIDAFVGLHGGTSTGSMSLLRKAGEAHSGTSIAQASWIVDVAAVPYYLRPAGCTPHSVTTSCGHYGDALGSKCYFRGVLSGGVKGDTGPAGTQGPQGLPGPAGADGKSVSIVGTVATSANLPTGLTAADAGKGWITNNDGHLWVWGGSSFTDVGLVRGPAGPTGATGATGATGPTGATGAAGPQGNNGANGTNGVDGAPGAQGPPGATIYFTENPSGSGLYETSWGLTETPVGSGLYAVP